MSDAAILHAAAAVVEAREATAPWLAGVRERLLALADEQPRATPDDDQEGQHP